jgi:23S rRNA (adenine2503-C2)-methyltransferase
VTGFLATMEIINNTLCGMTADELYESIRIHGFNMHQAVKVLLAVYRKGVTQIRQLKDIPKTLKSLLLSDYITGVYSPVKSEISTDNSVKYLFRNDQGLEFETVFIPDNKRNTVCVSTQAGCRMGCPFCLTGRYGFKGNLTEGDIINQVVSLPMSSKVSHVVFMGMGEPLDNIEAVLKACQILKSDWGLAVSSRNITVSTVGILPGIIKFLKKSDCNLALSLHSPFPEERELIVPVENKYPVLHIIDIMRSYPLIRKRRLSIAYVMIQDINDSDRHLEELKKLLQHSVIRVNLLPYHRVKEEPYLSSTAERMQFFKHNLVMAGISASIRKSRGEDISAACGLLASGLGKK